MRSSEAFPIVSLIGFGKMLSQFLGKPLERAVASSPEQKVVAIRDEGGFDITFDLVIEESVKEKVPVAAGVR